MKNDHNGEESKNKNRIGDNSPIKRYKQDETKEDWKDK